MSPIRRRFSRLAFVLGVAIAVSLAWFVVAPLFPPEAGDVRLLAVVQPAVLAARGALWGKGGPATRWRDGVNVAALALSIPGAVLFGAAGFVAAGALRVMAIAPGEQTA